jgi:hypothetical protein
MMSSSALAACRRTAGEGEEAAREATWEAEEEQIDKTREAKVDSCVRETVMRARRSRKARARRARRAGSGWESDAKEEAVEREVGSASGEAEPAARTASAARARAEGGQACALRSGGSADAACRAVALLRAHGSRRDRSSARQSDSEDETDHALRAACTASSASFATSLMPCV